MLSLFDTINQGRIYTIAEMSANHAGKLENALKIVHAAKEAGASCLKIQTYTADTLTIDCKSDCFMVHGGLWDGKSLYELYKEAYTPWEWQPRIKAECEKVGLDFLSTPFDRTAVDFLEEMDCEAYKIASFEIVDLPLIEYTASKGKPMILSCGMASEEEIADAVEACRRKGNHDIVLLKCCSEYPADPVYMNLSTIRDMEKRFHVVIGLSDHSMGYLADVTAVAQGARVIEKHFCLSRDIEDADSAFSMEPKEFGEMVKSVNEAALMLGSISYGPTEGEQEEYKSRRSLFVVKAMKKDEIFTGENVRSIRPGGGLPPKELPRVLGKRAACDISFGTPLSRDMILNPGRIMRT